MACDLSQLRPHPTAALFIFSGCLSLEAAPGAALRPRPSGRNGARASPVPVLCLCCGPWPQPPTAPAGSRLHQPLLPSTSGAACPLATSAGWKPVPPAGSVSCSASRFGSPSQIGSRGVGRQACGVQEGRSAGRHAARGRAAGPAPHSEMRGISERRPPLVVSTAADVVKQPDLSFTY